ncbi:hypothetical protein GCM10020000_42680 [Streptomyces olivoverticillatus]
MISASRWADTVLGTNPRTPAPQGPLQMPGTAVTGHDHGAAAGQFGPQGCGHHHTVQPWHLEIQYCHVRPVHARHRQCLAPRGGLGHDPQIVLEPEQRGERPTDQMLVVREHHTDRLTG